ncbi:DegT/DnrJ/EryC1/StrS family aminotransferase [Clostridium polynesiense]|uniref:DegT/DnrJ/EryC1/StrS family aminotransferase n=1 Tax=Clostridium polynesiense TaxID=1325933 RepID=UPI000A970A32
MRDFIPYAKPCFDEKEEKEVVAALKSNWISKGPKTHEFEKRFADFIGVKHAVALNSCTAALHLSLICAGISAGDEVITTPFTFAASVNTIIHCGGKPVFVDINPHTLCIDVDKIEEKITSNTKAILPVHYAGQSADLDKIHRLADKYKLFVSEDAAHALFTTYKDKLIGSLSDATSFSFYATKNLSTGEGGMLTTNDDSIAEKARVLSLHGMSKTAWNRYSKGGNWYYEIQYPGYKYNMTDIQAALGLQQLNKLEHMQSLRSKYADMYSKAFNNLSGIIIPEENPYGRHAWHIYAIQVDDKVLNINRDIFIEKLTESNIGTSVHFIPLHLQPYYKKTFGFKKGDFPICERTFERILSLPLYPSMKEEDVNYVISTVTRIVKECI